MKEEREPNSNRHFSLSLSRISLDTSHTLSPHLRQGIAEIARFCDPREGSDEETYKMVASWLIDWYSIHCFVAFFAMMQILESGSDHYKPRFSNGSRMCFFPPAAYVASPRRSVSYNRLQQPPLRITVLKLDGSSFGMFLFYFRGCRSVYALLCFCLILAYN